LVSGLGSARPSFFRPQPRRPALPSFPTRRSSDLDPGIVLDADELDPVLVQDRVAGPRVQVPRLADRPDVHDRLLRIGKRVAVVRSEEHTSELQSRENLVCRLLLEKKKKKCKPLTY